MKKGILLISACLFSMPILTFAQTINGDYEYQTHMSDPIEPINRVIWDFNYLFLDAYIYKPTTETYVDWVPDGGRKAINNFVLNFDEPSTVVNNLIQLEFKYALNALVRFSVNSTFGLLGFLDLAEKGGIPRRRETFSNVLGRWYVPHGPYLMVPIIGPRSTRKLVGGFIDGLYFPISYLTFGQTTTLLGLDGIDKREGVLGQEKLLEQSLDPYIFAKEAYMQYEAFKFYQNSDDINLLLQENQQQKSFEEQQNLDTFMDEID
jgi:phospholipid-binding lipoprotein MlaA